MDPDRCHGHARCLTFAPDVFTWDDEIDQARVDPGANLVGNQGEVRAAIDNCPERAISVVDDAP